jgi:serine/threonine-protein kinase SRPK1
MLVGKLLNNRYTVISELGEGTFSTVWRCNDEYNNIDVAVKIHKNENSCYKIAAKVEWELLSKIDHLNIIQLIDKFIYYDITGKHYCLVYELCDCDLYQIMKQSDDNNLAKIKKANGNIVFYNFDKIFITGIIRNLLNGLIELHSHKIIHTDIKPENILIKNGIAKISDFSTADWEYTCNSDTVGTRHYRSPENILGLNLTTTSDIWAIGCILFELITNDVLFYPRNYKAWGISRDEDHLALIVELLGSIPSWMLNGFRSYKFIKKNGKFKNIKNMYPWPLNQILNKRYKINDDMLVNLLNSMLEIDPNKRATAQDCLNHPYLN